MCRTTTLRQLITVLVDEVLKDEGALRSEKQALVEHILNNSTLSLTSDSIELNRGNYLGVGEENKDRMLIIPRFCVFTFGILDIFDSLKGKERAWHLKSLYSFKELEDAVRYKSVNKNIVVAIVDGEILDYEIKKSNIADAFGGFGSVVVWETYVYRLNYLLQDQEIEEKFQNLESLEQWIKHIVRQGAEEIEVYHLIEDYKMDFTVTQVAYNTNNQHDEGSWLLWQQRVSGTIEDDDEDEEDWDF